NAVTLSANTVLDETAGGNITFKSTVDAAAAGAQSLTAKTDGTTEFDGAVGTTALSSLDVGGHSAATAGATKLAGPSVTTSGGQTYNNGLSQLGDVHLTGSTLTLGPSWDALNHNLSLTFGSQITVQGLFANVKNFLSDGAGGTLIAVDFTTTGDQTYGNAVTLGGAGVRTLTSSGGGNI